MVVHWILFLLIHSVSIASASDQVLWAEFNSNVTLCCNLTLKETEALVFSVNDQRLSSLVLNPNSEPKSYVSKSARNWIFDRKKRNDICATKLDNQLTEVDNHTRITCERASETGLGDTIEKKFITLKFYEQAKIDEFPRNLRVREGSSQVIKCNASGFPDLYVVWRLKNGKVLNHSQKVNSSNTGNNSRSIILPLELTNIHPDQHGEVYVCEARTSQPVNSQTATRTVMLEVNLYPKINMSTNVIYTDLGVEEKFNIIVTGYPRPTLNCSDLPLGDPRVLSEQPQGGTLAYPVVINRVTLQHLHEYTCTANNSLASVNEKLELTVAPAPPKILSTNSTEFADYYLLHWQTQSRAPLKNVTISIHETSKNTEAGGSIVQRSPKNYERVFSLEHDKLDKVSTYIDDTSIQTGERKELLLNIGSSNLRRIWHHLTNLSADTQHDITLNVCNEYACSKSTTMRDQSGNLSGKFTFKTPKFDGSNKINPIVLQRSPKNTFASVVETELHNNGNYAGNLIPQRTLTVFYMLSFLVFAYWL